MPWRRSTPAERSKVNANGCRSQSASKPSHPERKRSAPFSQNPFVGDERDLLLFFFREAGYRQSHSIPRVIVSEKDAVFREDFPIIAEVLIHIFLFMAGIEINHVGGDSVIAKPQGCDGSRLRKRNDPVLQCLMTDIG